MKRISFIILLGISLISGLKSGWAADPIRADGSSTVFPITEAVAEEFGREGKGRVIVGISGTGGGFKRFCRAETDISNASRPIKQKEIDACREGGIQYIELKVAFDGLAVIVNPANTWVDYLTVEELKKIWEPEAQNVIMKWNQIRSGFPAQDLQLFGPGTDSGTFDYFTEAVNGKSGSSRGDFTASEDDNVLVEGVASNPGALGYFGLAYYEENRDKLKVVPIRGSGTGVVTPSQETVMNGTYEPLSRPLFIYVSRNSLKTKPAVRDFIRYYLKNATVLAEEVGYIPLPLSEYESGLSKIE